ncbi:ThiF family adenylyltransferase [Nonomuraea sp. NPDC046570]|uniref:ThiF family adenylyltransferase n=1 Tax=Nonomuraea sp. NPDC046570 TaxID=3155255 RepID=UPI003407CCE5
MRPRLKPALRRITRDERTLQFGVHPRRAVLLTDLAPPVREWVGSLDGTRDLREVMERARRVGLSERAALSLLGELTGRGLLDDASVPAPALRGLSLAESDRLRPELEALECRVADQGAVPSSRALAQPLASAFPRRQAARVRVYGAGRVGAPIVAMLAACGVGEIRVIDPGLARAEDLMPGGLGWSEVGMPRQDGAAVVARRLIGPPHPATPPHPAVPPSRAAGSSRRPRAAALPGPRPSSVAVGGGAQLGDGSQRPDLVILAPVGPLDNLLVNELVSLRIPHLLVSAFEGYGSVGPLVVPGETACLHCLDLTRRDRDPDWPIVTARLGGYPAGEIACDTTLATLVASLSVGHALAHLEGQGTPVTNGTIDVMPDWQWRRRSWAVHPHCRCFRNLFGAITMVTSGSCS